MNAYIGTSGWYYSQWNPDLTLDWFIEHSGFNAIELNASFYRFPFPNQITAWAKKGKPLRWVVKVHRSITHYGRFKGQSFERWQRFQKLFKPLDPLIDFYLFQLPPSFRPDKKKEIEDFYKKTKLKNRFALEWRHIDWFDDEHVSWANSLGMTLVSVDAPKFPRTIFTSQGRVYLRIHGRDKWYDYRYSTSQLSGMAKKIRNAHPKDVYVFFNNDEWMLENGRDLKRYLLRVNV
jgi:uncharacterized protein YecE (DUF72 family)